jgi:hypothetical protein
MTAPYTSATVNTSLMIEFAVFAVFSLPVVLTVIAAVSVSAGVDR